jgi:hypothetical protein
MNVSAIDPTKASLAQAAAATQAPAKKPAQAAAASTPAQEAPAAPAAPAARPAPAPVSTPAATVAISGVPATVKAEDRSLYLQILKSVGGNVNAALAGLAAAEAKEANT